MTVEEFYDQSIRVLPPGDRLRLATLILKDIPPESIVDVSHDWSEEDVQEAALHSFEHAAQSFGEDDDDA